MSHRTERTQVQTQLGKQKFTIYLHNHPGARIFTSGVPGLRGGKGKEIHTHKSAVVADLISSLLRHAP